MTVSEGGSVDISCTSTGVPAPTITWRLNNQATPFNQTDMTTTADIKINTNFAVDTIINGSVVSTLHIVNAQYPAHDGVYECIGDNSNGGSAPPSIANITVQVQGIDITTLANTASFHFSPLPSFNISIRSKFNEYGILQTYFFAGPERY